MAELKMLEYDPFREWKYPWRSDKQRDEGGPKMLTEKETLEFVRYLHEARYKVARKQPRDMGQYNALYGATVGVNYVLTNNLYNDHDIGRFLKDQIEVVPPLCKSCERPMEKVNGNYNVFEFRCPECGATGEELSFPPNLYNWSGD
jgi:hypothetical protein